LRRLAILGASGHGKVIADAAALLEWDITLFDDKWDAGATVGPWRIAGTLADLMSRPSDFDGVVVAIGDNEMRWQRQNELASRGALMVSIIHPSAVVSPHARLGEGTVILANAVLNPFAHVGRAVILNTGCSVDHDCELADAVHVSPGARLGGNVRVGTGTWIGIGAAIKHGVSIGARSRIGAGAAVINDVADGLTVVGVPAKPR
jgi:sugar O-acyltransferase (sialic acid O-acetyltransferase NeuD family)